MAVRNKRNPLSCDMRMLTVVVIVVLAAFTTLCNAKKRSEISKEIYSKRNSKEYNVKTLPDLPAGKINICNYIDEKHINVICHCSPEPLYNATTAVCTVVGSGEPENSTFWESFSTQQYLEELSINIRREITHHFIPTNALKALRRLKRFHLVYASVTEVPPFAFANLSTLEELYLKDNGITILKPRSFAWMANLTKVTLSVNNIGEIQRDVFMGVTALKQLILDENNISVIHDKAFFHLTSLAQLYLSRNKLVVLTREVFLGLKSLQILDLDHNNLRMIGECNFCEMPHLKELYLRSNSISFIHSRAFDNLRSLERLDLENNEIEVLHPLTFVGLDKIYYLNLRNNKLLTLEAETMKPLMTRLYNINTTFIIEENDFICDCRLSWMFVVRNETPNDIIRETLEDVTCTFLPVESNSVVNGAGVSYAVIDKSAKAVSSDPATLQQVSSHGGRIKEPDDDQNLSSTLVSNGHTKLGVGQADSEPVSKLSTIQPEDLPCPEELKAKPVASEGPNVFEEDNNNSSNHISEIQNLATGLRHSSCATQSFSSVLLVTSLFLVLT